MPTFTMGDRIRKARRHQRPTVTQDALSEALSAAGLEISSQGIGNWESGANGVSEEHRALVARVVADLTGVSEEWLLEGVGYEPAPLPPVSLRGVAPLAFLPPRRPTNPCLPVRDATVFTWRSRPTLIPVRRHAA